jgi:hypothetical protein
LFITMESEAEATVNPDGTTSGYQNVPPTPAAEPLNAEPSPPPAMDPVAYDGAGGGGGGFFGDGGAGDSSVPPNGDSDEFPDMEKEAAAGEAGSFRIDPAFYLIATFLVAIAIYWFFFLRKKKEEEGNDVFFASIDSDKV